MLGATAAIAWAESGQAIRTFERSLGAQVRCRLMRHCRDAAQPEASSPSSAEGRGRPALVAARRNFPDQEA
ncbi:MAG: hypothetical protein NZM40_08015 [Sphingomonadaceae bacterium]|uniref:hypothetical protein n=1 Tax=Thermaurantiacus sp. TaxID=2820283 RepID=UPI00298F27E5|nr:hypothetical protein [Thermaurantiacus sp.]MCS6987356.1 hypothetical protein [Sphingomonadaceae bacterium]MDW8414577.1 hypothetical protein [Thermaurantiacus sp.]